MPRKKCSFRLEGKECHKDARYMMGCPSAEPFRVTEGEGYFGLVCGEHDRELGRANLMVLLGISKREAIALDLRMDAEARKERQDDEA